MGVFGYFEKWKHARLERRIQERNEIQERQIAALTAKAAFLNENQQYELTSLAQWGFVRAQAKGESITKIHATVENLIRKRIRVVVKIGTFFVASGGHQNMATTKEYTFLLSPGPYSIERFNANAVCIDAGKPIPSEYSSFDGVSTVYSDVARFIEASQEEDPMVIQAGVWTLTNYYSEKQIQERLVIRNREDLLGRNPPAITFEHIRKASSILRDLGIKDHFWSF